MTIVLKGEDIDAERVESLLDVFIKKHTERVIVCFERGSIEEYLHVQACMVVITTTPQQFKLQIERALGYEKGSRPVNLSICLRQLTGKGLQTVQGLVGYCRKAKDAVDFREITHKITDQDKTEGDLLFILHGRTESSKTKVSLTGRNIISKMLVFLKYKTKTILCHTRDPLCLLLKMVSVSVFVSSCVCVHRDTHRHVHTQMRTGHYELPPTWVHEREGLDLVRFNSLWKSNVLPEDLQVQEIVNIMFPRAHFGGDDTDSTDEDTNLTQASSSSGLRDDTHSNEKRHRARYFNKTDNKVKGVTDAARFQDGLNEFKGQRSCKILSQALISFDNG